MIYLDNAATTFPKPATVLNRMVEERAYERFQDIVRVVWGILGSLF